MEKNGIEYANAVIADVAGLVELEKKVWKNMAAEEAVWISRINTYSKGIFVATKNNEIVGVVVTCRINWPYGEAEHPTWEEASGNGFLTTHRDDGEFTFGVDLSSYGNPGVASELLKLAIELHKKNKTRKAFLGGRIPSLSGYVKRNNIDSETLTSEKVLSLSKEDLHVNFFCSNGFRVVTAKKDYFPQDKDSLGWGIILEVLK